MDVDQISLLHETAVGRWHEEKIDNPYDGFLHAVCQEHAYNYRLWHLESIAHSTDVADVRLAGIKLRINTLNLHRNNWIEKLDELLLKKLRENGNHAGDGTPVNTETPGSVIDRLSILVLRIYHLVRIIQNHEPDPQRHEQARTNLAICRRQREDLVGALKQLLEDLSAGRKQLKLYRHLKMYNGPTPASEDG